MSELPSLAQTKHPKQQKSKHSPRPNSKKKVPCPNSKKINLRPNGKRIQTHPPKEQINKHDPPAPTAEKDTRPLPCPPQQPKNEHAPGPNSKKKPHPAQTTLFGREGVFAENQILPFFFPVWAVATPPQKQQTKNMHPPKQQKKQRKDQTTKKKHFYPVISKDVTRRRCFCGPALSWSGCSAKSVPSAVYLDGRLHS